MAAFRKVAGRLLKFVKYTNILKHPGHWTHHSGVCPLGWICLSLSSWLFEKVSSFYSENLYHLGGKKHFLPIVLTQNSYLPSTSTRLGYLMPWTYGRTVGDGLWHLGPAEKPRCLWDCQVWVPSKSTYESTHLLPNPWVCQTNYCGKLHSSLFSPPRIDICFLQDLMVQ